MGSNVGVFRHVLTGQEVRAEKVGKLWRVVTATGKDQVVDDETFRKSYDFVRPH